MAEKFVDVLFPVGRLIGGDLYEPKRTNMSGEPLLLKNGQNKGQPYVDYFIQIAIPKTPGVQHWSQEVSANPRIGAWGAKIWQFGHDAWGAIAGQNPRFSWKITDGDSQEYDQGAPPKRHCDKANYPGNWIVNMSRLQAPKICNADGSAFLLEVGAVKRGYFVQVHATIKSNETANKMGVYITHNGVSLQFLGEEISTGIDPRNAGFGGNSAPVGAQQIPPGAIVTGSAPVAYTPPAPPMAGYAAPIAPAPTYAPPVMGAPSAPAPGYAPPPAPPSNIVPNVGFVQNVIAPPPPAAPPAPPAGPRMLKNGATYDSYVAAGWSDTQIAQSGLM